MQTPQQTGEILSPDQSPCLTQGNPQLAALLRPFGPSASATNSIQRNSHPVCKLLQASSDDSHLLAASKSAGQVLLDSTDERGCDE
jgi:hypothetical protein